MDVHNFVTTITSFRKRNSKVKQCKIDAPNIIVCESLQPILQYLSLCPSASQSPAATCRCGPHRIGQRASDHHTWVHRGILPAGTLAQPDSLNTVNNSGAKQPKSNSRFPGLGSFVIPVYCQYTTLVTQPLLFAHQEDIFGKKEKYIDPPYLIFPKNMTEKKIILCTQENGKIPLNLTEQKNSSV